MKNEINKTCTTTKSKIKLVECEKNYPLEARFGNKSYGYQRALPVATSGFLMYNLCQNAPQYIKSSCCSICKHRLSCQISRGFGHLLHTLTCTCITYVYEHPVMNVTLYRHQVLPRGKYVLAYFHVTYVIDIYDCDNNQNEGSDARTYDIVQ